MWLTVELAVPNTDEAASGRATQMVRVHTSAHRPARGTTSYRWGPCLSNGWRAATACASASSAVLGKPFGQPHRPDESDEARLGAQRIEDGIHGKVGEPAASLGVRTLHPVEGAAELTET